MTKSSVIDEHEGPGEICDLKAINVHRVFQSSNKCWIRQAAKDSFERNAMSTRNSTGYHTMFRVCRPKVEEYTDAWPSRPALGIRHNYVKTTLVPVPVECGPLMIIFG